MPVFSKFITSQRGGKILVDTDGNLYNFKRTSFKAEVFVCRSKKPPCKATVKLTAPDNEMEILTPHVSNHAPPPRDTADALEFTKNLKRKATEQCHTSTQNILTQCLIDNPNVSHLLANHHSLARNIQLAKAKAKGFTEPQATNLEDFVLPPEAMQTFHGKSFLLYDEPAPRKERLMVFSTADNMDMLSACKLWLCDGTFWVAPKDFTQSYTIHANIFGKSIPLVYALLPDKKEETYRKFLEVITNAVNITDFNGLKIILDFQVSPIKLFLELF